MFWAAILESDEDDNQQEKHGDTIKHQLGVHVRNIPCEVVVLNKLYWGAVEIRARYSITGRAQGKGSEFRRFVPHTVYSKISGFDQNQF